MRTINKENRSIINDRIIKLHYEERLNGEQIAQLLGVSRHYACDIIRKFAIENNVKSEFMKQTEQQLLSENPSKDAQIRELKTQIARLEHLIEKKDKEIASKEKQYQEEKEWSQLKERAFNMLIDKAEKQFNIPIRKK